jgi:sugar phosphate isomerase/epimerase
MNLGLINSTWVQAGRGTAFGIQQTRELGFDSIDIFLDPLDAPMTEKKLTRDECAAAGLPIISVASVAVGLIDFNPSVRRFHLDRGRAYLDLCAYFEAKNLLLVLGEYIWQREVIAPDFQWGLAVDALKALGDHAADLGLEIALELEPFHQSLLNDVPKLVQFLDDVGHPAVLANVDISHLVLAHEPPESIDALRGRVAHVHISDCDGKVHGDLPPGRGVVPFAPYLEAIKKLGRDDLTISVELEFAPDPDHIVDWVRESYEASARLMKSAGLRE